MTPTEKLERIKEKCQWLIENSVDQPMAEAGWRATIAAIDWINSDHGIPDRYSQDCVDEGVTRLTESILVVWPEKLI